MMTKAQLRRYLEAATYRFARTMPKIAHWYTLRKTWEDQALFEAVEELLKLKQITGFSALFKNAEYSKAWETKHMIRYRLEYQKIHGQM